MRVRIHKDYSQDLSRQDSVHGISLHTMGHEKYTHKGHGGVGSLSIGCVHQGEMMHGHRGGAGPVILDDKRESLGAHANSRQSNI